MYKKNKIKIHHIIIASFIGFLLIIAFLSKLIDDNRKLTLPEKLVKDTGLFINKIVYIPINYASDLINTYNEKNKFYKKYQALQKEVDRTNDLKVQNEELKNEVQKMKDLLKLNESLYEFKYLNATVINRNIGYWFNTITIDKGSSNGIVKGMPAVIKDGLIGKVISTTNFTSTIKLITTDDTNNKISVKVNVNGKYIYGILSSYNAQKKVFIVDGIDQSINIPIDSLVVTSGLSDLYPSGIVVGKVASIKTDNFDLAKTLEVTSLADFDDLSFVTILMKEAEL